VSGISTGKDSGDTGISADQPCGLDTAPSPVVHQDQYRGNWSETRFFGHFVGDAVNRRKPDHEMASSDLGSGRRLHAQ